MTNGENIELVNVAAKVPKDMKGKLEELAEKKGVNLSEVVREALDSYISSHEEGVNEVNEAETEVNPSEETEVKVNFDMEEIKKVVADTVKATLEEVFAIAEGQAIENYLNEAEVIANFLEKVKEGDKEAMSMVKNVLGVEGLKALYEKASWGEI